MTRCTYFKHMDCNVIDNLISEVGKEKAYELLKGYCANCGRRRNKERASGYPPERRY